MDQMKMAESLLIVSATLDGLEMLALPCPNCEEHYALIRSAKQRLWDVSKVLRESKSE